MLEEESSRRLSLPTSLFKLPPSPLSSCPLPSLQTSILLLSTMASVVTKALGLFDIQGAKANVRCV